MAKIPQENIDSIRNLISQISELEREVIQLTNFVNDDAVSWNGIEITITEAIRQQMIDAYADYKSQMAVLFQALP